MVHDHDLMGDGHKDDFSNPDLGGLILGLQILANKEMFLEHLHSPPKSPKWSSQANSIYHIHGKKGFSVFDGRN